MTAFLIGFAVVAGACVMARRMVANIVHYASLQGDHLWHD